MPVTKTTGAAYILKGIVCAVIASVVARWFPGVYKSLRQ